MRILIDDLEVDLDFGTGVEEVVGIDVEAGIIKRKRKVNHFMKTKTMIF